MEWLILMAISTGLFSSIYFYLNRSKQNRIEYYDDENLDLEIKLQKQKMDKFISIVGEEPMKQIDWIINNGLDKFNDTYNKVMSGEYIEERTQRPVPRISPNLHVSGEVGYVRGGMGNKKLVSWSYSRVYTCAVCEHTFQQETMYVDLVKCPKCNA